MAGESRNRANENGMAITASEGHFSEEESEPERRGHNLRSYCDLRKLGPTRGPLALSLVVSKIVACLGQDSVHSNTSLKSQFIIF